MDAASHAFPDAWQQGSKGNGKGKKAGKAGTGRRKGNHQAKGKGKTTELSEAREQELRAQLQSLVNGTESSAIPRVGDDVQVLRVLGQDRRHLEGRVGKVIGTLTPGDGCTVHFAADGAAFGQSGLDLTLARADVRVVEAQRPLPEAALQFPKTLNGLERKFVHASAEELGLITQSFGEKEDRYITAYRRAEEGCSTIRLAQSCCEEAVRDHSDNVYASGIDIDEASLEEALSALAPQIPQEWQTSRPAKMLLCRGSLKNPIKSDRRTVTEDLLKQLSSLRAGDCVELRVVSLGKNDRALALGVLGAPCLGRNPHVAVAAVPGAGTWPGESISQWSQWTGGALVLRGSVVEWSRPSEAPDTEENPRS